MSARATPPLATPWVPLWPISPTQMGELAYAERTTTLTLSGNNPEANAATVVQAPQIVCDGTPLLIEIGCTAFSPGADMIFSLFEDGISLGRFLYHYGGGTWGYRGTRRHTPTPGAHTYSWRAWSSDGTGSITAGAGGPNITLPAYIRITPAAPLVQAAPGAVVPVQYGTTLPASPLDGQEAILTDSLTAPTYAWRFRYSTAITDAYKWVYVGGAEAYNSVAAAQSTTSGTYVNLTTPGPTLTLPRAGIYEVNLGFDASTGTSATIYASPKFGAAATADADATRYRANYSAATSVSRKNQKTVTEVGAVLLVQYRTDGAQSGTYENRWLSVKPVRVA